MTLDAQLDGPGRERLGDPETGAGHARWGAAAANRHTIRVASIPADHVYVRHIRNPGDGVVVLADRPDRPWWPPERLSRDWVEAHCDDFDIFHVHFGFDAWDPCVLDDVCHALRAAGKPLVYTAHDLRNPHHREPGLHERQFAVWMRAADAVITLTAGAARVIAQRWGREATVIVHPYVVPVEQMPADRARSARPVVGIHFKSLRANMFGAEALWPVIDSLHGSGARLRVDVHSDVMASAEPLAHELGTALRDADAAGTIELSVHDFFDDEAFFGYLRSLAVSVLPYRFGSHSGWLEACHDLGTQVVAPDCGFYADQGPVFGYHVSEEGELDAASLQRAVREALTFPRPSRGSDARLAERNAIACAHRALYERLLRGAPSSVRGGVG